MMYPKDAEPPNARSMAHHEKIHSMVVCLLIPLVILVGFPQFCVGSTDTLTPKERQWLSAHDGKILINNGGEGPPILFTDENGTSLGVSVDYYRLIEQKLNFKFKRDEHDTWDNILNKLYDKKIDVICHIQKNSGRSKHILFTRHYFEMPGVIIVNNRIKGTLTLPDMRGMTIGVINGDIVHEYIEEKYGYLELVPLKNSKICIVEVSRGKVDAAVIFLGVAVYIMEKEKISNLRIAGESGHRYQLSFGVRNDWPILRDILEKGLALITPKEREAIYKKWISLKYTPFYANTKFWFTLIGVIGGIGVFTFLSLFWNQQLKRAVRRKTITLEKQTNLLQRKIEERREAQQALIAKQEELETVLDNIQGLAYRIMFDPDGVGKIRYISKHIIDITGYHPETFIGQPAEKMLEVVHPDDQGKMIQLLENPLIKKEIFEGEYRFINKAGDTRWVYGKGTVHMHPDGTPKHLDGFAVDITERKNLEAQLRQGQKMENIGILASGIAHDFNNILGGIIGFSELMKQKADQLKDNDLLHRKIDRIIKGGERAGDLVAQILSFSRSGKEQGTRDAIHVAGIAKEVIRLMRTSLPQGITIRQDLQSDKSVRMDAIKLHQILMNLCTNAGHAMKETQGTLTVSLKDLTLESEIGSKEKGNSGNHILISVEDTGHGMDDAVLSRIMEPFFTTKPKGQGTGMGLWLSRKIIHEAGGVMEVSSQVGQGSRFDVYLPVAETQTDEEASKEIPERTLMGDEHILIVDDEKTLIHLMTEALDNLGYRVTAFNSAVAALKHFKEKPKIFDLIITDMSMPQMTGDQLCRQMRIVRNDLPVILTTGFIQDEDLHSAGELFNAVLEKPVLVNTLTKTVRKVLDNLGGTRCNTNTVSMTVMPTH